MGPDPKGWAFPLAVSIAEAFGFSTFFRFFRERKKYWITGPHDLAVRGTPNARRLDGLDTHPPKSDEERLSIGRLRAVFSLTDSGRARPATTSARPTLPRPPHPAPRLVTIAKRPSLGDGMAGVVRVIWGNREADYFGGRSLLICGVGQISAGQCPRRSRRLRSRATSYR